MMNNILFEAFVKCSKNRPILCEIAGLPCENEQLLCLHTKSPRLYLEYVLCFVSVEYLH